MSSFKNIGKTEQCRNVFRIFIVLRSARKYRCFQSYVCGFIHLKPEGKTLIHLTERLSYFCRQAENCWVIFRDFFENRKFSLKSQHKKFFKKSENSRNFRFFSETFYIDFSMKFFDFLKNHPLFFWLGDKSK